VTRHPATLARTEVGAAAVGKWLLVVGGFRKQDAATTSAVERYDIETDTWKRVHSMPIALNHAAAASWGGHLYVVGGYTSAHGLSHESRRLFRYGIPHDRWVELPPMPTARAALGATAVQNRLMYAVGGARGGKPLRRLDVYSFKHRRWRKGPPMPTAREHLAVASAGGYVYALGGRVAGKGNLAVAERFDTARHRWERLPDMAKARSGIAAVRVGQSIVVFGGEEAGGTIREVEMYDPSERRWTPLPDMRTPRHGLGGAVLHRRVFAVEGGPQPGLHFSRAIEALDVPAP
jgi:N-acetylneuraminic acid mutarotase